MLRCSCGTVPCYSIKNDEVEKQILKTIALCAQDTRYRDVTWGLKLQLISHFRSEGLTATD